MDNYKILIFICVQHMVFIKNDGCCEFQMVLLNNNNNNLPVIGVGLNTNVIKLRYIEPTNILKKINTYHYCDFKCNIKNDFNNLKNDNFCLDLNNSIHNITNNNYCCTIIIGLYFKKNFLYNKFKLN